MLGLTFSFATQFIVGVIGFCGSLKESWPTR